MTSVSSVDGEHSQARLSPSPEDTETVVQPAHSIPPSPRRPTPAASEAVLCKIPFLKSSSMIPTSEKAKGKPVVVSDVQISPPGASKVPTASKIKSGKGKASDPSKIKSSSRSRSSSKKSSRVKTTGLPEVSLPQRGKKDRLPEDPEEKAERLRDRVTKIDKHGVQHKVVYKHKDRHHYVPYDHPDTEPCIDKRQVTRRTYLRDQRVAENDKNQRENEDPDPSAVHPPDDVQPSEADTSVASKVSKETEPTPTASEDPEVTH